MKTHLAKEADLPGIAKNALCTLPIGSRFNQHGLLLDFTKVGGVMMTEAEILLDVDWVSLTLKQKKGPSIRLLKEIPASVIFDILNKYPEASRSGYTYAGCIYIPFARDNLGLLTDPNALVVGMLDIDHYILNVKFLDPVALTTVLVGVIPEVDRGPKRPLGEHIRLEKSERSHTTISVENVTELPFGEPNTAMLGYHVDLGATGVLDDVEVRFNEELLHDPLTIAQNNYLLHRAGKSPQSGWFDVDFNRKGSALPVGVATSFRQKFNWSTAPNAYEVYSEMVYNMGAVNYVP